MIGSTTYLRLDPSNDGGRPWVRFKAPGVGAASFPFHGSSIEASLGGTGAYAGLINLLGTATGEVGVVGPIAVDGQQTTEFAATVEPLSLVKGITATDLARIHEQVSPEKIEVFLTKAGLPLRVVGSSKIGTDSTVQTMDILAIDIPVTVKPPPARETVGQLQLKKLQAREGKSSSSAQPK